MSVERRAAWVHPDQATARKAIGIPLNEDAVAVIRGRLGKHLRGVFIGLDGVPMECWTSAAQQAFEAACKEAGITAFRWHDLRHTWASW